MIVGAATSLVIYYLYHLTQVNPFVLGMCRYRAEKTAPVLTVTSRKAAGNDWQQISSRPTRLSSPQTAP